MDIAFLIDSSSNSGIKNYRRETFLTKLVAQRLGISPSRSQAAIILYGESAKIEAYFGHHTNTGYFERTVNRLPHFPSQNGGKRLKEALHLAATKVFPGARKSVSKAVVVLTCGAQSEDLKIPVKNLRNAGVRILVVGVGDDVHIKELRNITESENDIFLSKAYGDLTQTADAIVENVCPRNGKFCGSVAEASSPAP